MLSFNQAQSGVEAKERKIQKLLKNVNTIIFLALKRPLNLFLVAPFGG